MGMKRRFFGTLAASAFFYYALWLREFAPRDPSSLRSRELLRLRGRSSSRDDRASW